MSRTMIVALILALLPPLIACSDGQENGLEEAKKPTKEIQESINGEVKDLSKKEMPEGLDEQLEKFGASATREMAPTTNKLAEDSRKELRKGRYRIMPSSL